MEECIAIGRVPYYTELRAVLQYGYRYITVRRTTEQGARFISLEVGGSTLSEGSICLFFLSLVVSLM